MNLHQIRIIWRVITFAVLISIILGFLYVFVYNTLSYQKLDKATLSKLCRVNTPRRRLWSYIIIHHSGTQTGGAKSFDRSHREERGWKHGLGYHFVIGNGSNTFDGQIEVGQRWKQQIDGAHCNVRDMNRQSIGICLVGNFQNRAPRSLPMESLVALVAHLQEEFGIPLDNVLLHKDLKETDCPGQYFPVSTFSNRLDRITRRTDTSGRSTHP